jgi:ketosteroid isomerase-like protein
MMKNQDAIAELEQLELSWAQAVKDRDLVLLDRVLGSEFTLTTGRPGFEIASRQQYLEVTRDRYVVDWFAFERLEVRVYEEAAVVRSRYRQRGSMDGADRSTAYLMTDVWIHRGGSWTCVARHATPLSGAR